MFKCKIALVFLVVLAVYLQQTQGTPIVAKKAVKVPVAVAKIGIAKAVAAKIKLAAFKKWAAAKAIAKAPFVLGKKAVLFKIGAVKSVAAFKVAKAGAILGLASKKVAPAVAAVAAIPAAVAAIPAAVAALPAAITGIPAAAVAALKPAEAVVVPVPEEVNVYTIPVSETHYQVAAPNAHFTSTIISSYHDAPSVSLLPAGQVSSNYEYYQVSDDKHESHGTVDHHDIQELPHQDTHDVVVPHSTYGVPN